MSHFSRHDPAAVEARITPHTRGIVAVGIIIAGFNRFKDDSGRPDYFSREFYYRIS